jgi:hypothetical protein
MLRLMIQHQLLSLLLLLLLLAVAVAVVRQPEEGF